MNQEPTHNDRHNRIKSNGISRRTAEPAAEYGENSRYLPIASLASALPVAGRESVSEFLAIALIDDHYDSIDDRSQDWLNESSEKASRDICSGGVLS